jgi:hypothetical protein
MKSRTIRWAGHVECMDRTAYRRPLRIFWRRWEDNIKMDLWEIGWNSRDWFHLTRDRDQWRALVNTVMNLRGSINCWGNLR